MTIRHLVVVGGTWERRWGILGSVAAHPAVTAGWRTHWIDYPASYGTPLSVTASVTLGADALTRSLVRVAGQQTEIAVLGFSQGAMVVETALRSMHDSQTVENLGVLNRIRYVGLCGNPYRAAGDQVGPDPGGYGIVGPLAPRGVVPIVRPRAWENFALPGDLISSCPDDSLIRLIYPFTRMMSPHLLDQWANDVLAKLNLTWLWRNVPETRTVSGLPRLLRRLHTDVDAAYQYLTTGVHGRYGIQDVAGRTPAQHIIRALQEVEAS